MTGKRNPGPFEAAVASAHAALKVAKAINVKPELGQFETFDQWWATYYAGVRDPVSPAAAREIAHNAWNGALRSRAK